MRFLRPQPACRPARLRVLRAASALLATIGVAVLSPAGAHYITEYWEAKVAEGACFIAVNASLELFTDEDAAFGQEIEAVVSFVTPHGGAENPFEYISGFEHEPMYLNVQILPSDGVRRTGKTVSDVRIDFGGETQRMTLDPHWLDPSVPVYLLGADDTAPIWSFLVDGKSIAIELTLGESVNLRVPVQDDQLQLAHAMHRACAADAANLPPNGG